VASTVAFLASADSGFTTGHYLEVNGGLAMD
jgi:3-oxoacyl-[acyl-carrier protein] reductase